MNPLIPGASSDVLVATESGRVVVDGVRHRVRRGLTTAHPDAAIVAARPDIWAPFVVDHPAPAKKKAAPAKKAAATVDEG